VVTCEDEVNGELVEKYLQQELSDDSREAFEQHYFECDRCFERLQTCRALQVELARDRPAAQRVPPARPWIQRWGWLPAAAILVLTTSLVLWQRDVPVTPPPVDTRQSDAPGPRPDAAPPVPSLVELGRVEPPAYVPGRLRGVQDEATARFADAMRQYQQGDYRAATTGLAAAARLDPEAPHIQFYLGVSHLLTGETNAAIASLQRIVALGDSPFMEDARFFLAKAYLQNRDATAAEQALTATIELRGEREAEARRLLDQLRAVAKLAG
jgi:hypothetical protein